MAITLIPDNTSVDFIGIKKLAFAASLLLILLSVFMFVTRGLNLGIDFTGGIVLEVRQEQAADLSAMRSALGELNLGEVSLQNFGTNAGDVMIRIQAEDGADQAAIVEHVKEGLVKALDTPLEYRKVDYVGPQVGRELVEAGAEAAVSAFFAILLYIWFRFEWNFGVGAVAALIHDVLLTIGFFAITRLEFNLTSIAAVLTIVGYSINDSVVIYDRIRENLRKYKKMPLPELINLSINETLSRTILTAGTTILALLALAIFGGEVLKSFSYSVLFGVTIGTYSSIYIAAPMLDMMTLRRETFTETAESQ